MNNAPPPPDAVIYKLTAGYLLQLGNGNTVACSNETALSRAIRNYFGPERPMQIRAPSQRPTDPNLAVVPTSELLKKPAQDDSRVEKVSGKMQRPFTAQGDVNPLLAQDNLAKLCVAYAAGQLSPELWERGVQSACPGISMKEAKLTLASYTGIPEAPANRALPTRDEQDHYKLAPDLDRPWEDHDQTTVLDLIEDVPTVTQIPTIMESYTAESVPVDEETDVVKDIAEYAGTRDIEDWMAQPL